VRFDPKAYWFLEVEIDGGTVKLFAVPRSEVMALARDKIAHLEKVTPDSMKWEH